MDFAQFKRELEAKKELKAAVQSEAGQKLLRQMDAAEVERAAKSGDTAALKNILSRVLSSPEGRELAEKVQKAMEHE